VLPAFGTFPRLSRPSPLQAAVCAIAHGCRDGWRFVCLFIHPCLGSTTFHHGGRCERQRFFGVMTMVIAAAEGPSKYFNWPLQDVRRPIPVHRSDLWSIGFMVTFVSVGMDRRVGWPCLMPDSVLHNSLFRIAHFHNVNNRGWHVCRLDGGVKVWFPKIGLQARRKLGHELRSGAADRLENRFHAALRAGMMGMTRSHAELRRRQLATWLVVGSGRP